MPESCPLELTDVMDVSCPFLNMGSVVAMYLFVVYLTNDSLWTDREGPLEGVLVLTLGQMLCSIEIRYLNK